MGESAPGAPRSLGNTFLHLPLELRKEGRHTLFELRKERQWQRNGSPMSSCEECSTCSSSRPCSSAPCMAGASPSDSSKALAARCAWDRDHSIQPSIGSRNEGSSRRP